MSHGYLSVETRIADSSIPVTGSKVYIIPSDRGSEVSDTFYNYFLVTDSSGNTGFIKIETPDESLGNNINNNQAPYSVVDVYIQSDGFFPTRVKNVQIFGGTQSILPITLIPVTGSYSDTSAGTVIYTIPSSGLLSRDTHSMKGPTSQQAEPLIADDIYIPETITVHLGTPASNAQNIVVPFTDYVKNVASSEIFPSWPEEALRANIAAIISLTLNRFFTEWYRSQGYDFDITSTTSYDQSYVQGRNIFENISRLVDEVFNTYVTREGYINPLFTSFCDGKTVNCDGLSQWGTVSLAESGNNALQILRYYYGDDVNLTTTNDIRSAESSYPGTPLRLGDTGEDVITIQQQLMRIRENYPAIPLIPTIDGVFGSSTDLAVRTFQEIFDLSVDGIVGKSTWYRISYIYSSVSKLSETIGEGVSDIFSEEIPNVTISVGDSGNYVLLLQSLIDYISLFYPSVPAVTKDSLFGRNTEDSVKQFQKTFGLTESGVVTPLVWNALYQVYLNIIKSITPSLPNQGFTGDLKRGDSGESVRLLQTYLNTVARRYPGISPVSEDGFYGSDTENSVLEFQRALRLNPTGVTDVSTWERLVELYNFEEGMTTN